MKLFVCKYELDYLYARAYLDGSYRKPPDPKMCGAHLDNLISAMESLARHEKDTIELDRLRAERDSLKDGQSQARH